MDQVSAGATTALAECAILIGMDVDELQHALGGIVLEAAYMERVLRAAFSALVGSKYAAVADGRMAAACHEVNRKRNRVIHDTWATRPRGDDRRARPGLGPPRRPAPPRARPRHQRRSRPVARGLAVVPAA
jgi:hypothetical protein